MAYRIENGELIVDGWENGISNNPYKGLNDMRGMNIISVPGEASVSFAPTLSSFASITGTVVSADPTNEKITGTSTGTLATGQAVVFTGASLPTGLTAGTTYWVSSVTSQNPAVFTVSTEVGGGVGGLVDITATGTGTFATINIGKITYFDKTSGACIDTNGRVWVKNGTFFVFTGNSGNSGNGNGLIYWHGYLFAFKNHEIDYTPYTLGSLTGITWTAAWQIMNTASGTNNVHEAFIHPTNDYVYFTDDNFVGQFYELPGKTFSPTDATTFSYDSQALVLPKTDIATCLEQLGGNYLLIGGTKNYIYSWDLTSLNFNNLIQIADNYIYHLITVNTNTYIFSGKRGRIYYTNGSQAQLYSKIPDHISGSVDPVISWGNCTYFKNQVYFGVSATDNNSNAITSYAGVWAIDITTEALRVPFLASSTTASISAIYADNSTNAGYSLYIAWNVGSTYGIDYSSNSPYDSYIPYIETDIIPIGNYLRKYTFQNIELKLTRPLLTSEAIKVSYRNIKHYTSGISDSYTQIFEMNPDTNDTDGTISLAQIINFDLSQWIQFKIESKSKAIGSSPSFVPLYELRLR